MPMLLFWQRRIGARRRVDEHFIYITVSTGIGGGIIISGELYRGAHNTHPEFGHQVIDASGPSVLLPGSRMLGKPGERPGNGFLDARAAAFRPGTHGSANLYACRGRATPWRVRSVEREGYYLGLGLANLITLFAPDTIALGGGVMKSSHLFLDRARDVIREVCTQVPDAKTQITLASLGADTGLAGAAQAWLCRYQGSDEV